MITMIIIILIISSIKTIEHVFPLFILRHTIECYILVHKSLYTLLTNLKYSSAWFGDILVEVGRFLYGW